MATIRTTNRRARLRARMRPWLARLEPLAAGTRPDLPCAVKRVLRAREPDTMGTLRLAWLTGLCVPFTGPHDGMTSLMLDQPRRWPWRRRRWQIGPDGAQWWLLPPGDGQRVL